VWALNLWAPVQLNVLNTYKSLPEYMTVYRAKMLRVQKGLL